MRCFFRSETEQNMGERSATSEPHILVLGEPNGAIAE
jgi:hypothetical protein